MFCANCGNELSDNALFCSACGNPVKSVTPVRNETASIVPAGKKIRYKCSCGSVQDTKEGASCNKCGKPLASDCGYYKLYRMGNFMGAAGGFGIYIDGEPYGHIGNKQTCWIRLPYGTHNIHIAVGISRQCTDQQFTLTPDHPLECGKVHMRVGAFKNSFVIEPADNSEVPD